MSTRTKVFAVVGVIVLLAIIGAASSGGDKKKDKSRAASAKVTTTTKEAKPSTTADTEPAKAPATKPTPPKSDAQQLREALDDASPVGAGEVIVKDIDYGKDLTITLQTPKGGFQGASWDDLDDSVAAAFKAVYGEAKYPASKKTVVVFEGDLVNSKTGKDLPHATTGIYTIKGREARDIDWSDDDALNYNIDWSNYRDFAHPALKHD